ncbi:MAG: hypothetical protein AAB317_02465 [Nitrospirota bacterium]
MIPSRNLARRPLRRFFVFLPVLFLIFILKTDAGAAVLLLPSLSISEEYDDNFLFSENNRTGEFTTTLSPLLTLRYANRYVILDTNYRGGATYHVHHPELDGYVQNLYFDIQLPVLARTFNGVDIRITEAADRLDELPSTPIGGAAGVGAGRGKVTRNRASIAVGYPWSPRHKTDVTYLNTIIKYHTELIEDFVSQDIGINETYGLSYQLRGTAQYGVSYTRFEEGSTVTVQRVSFGGQYNITPDLLVLGGVGSSFLSGSKPSTTYNLALSNLSHRPSFRMGYSRTLSSREGGLSSAIVRDGMFTEGTYLFSERTSVSLRLNYSRENGLLGAAHKASDTGATLTGGIQFLPWLSGLARYVYLLRQEDAITSSTVYRNRISFTLSASDPGWKLLE